MGIPGVDPTTLRDTVEELRAIRHYSVWCSRPDGRADRRRLRELRLVATRVLEPERRRRGKITRVLDERRTPLSGGAAPIVGAAIARGCARRPRQKKPRLRSATSSGSRRADTFPVAACSPSWESGRVTPRLCMSRLPPCTTALAEQRAVPWFRTSSRSRSPRDHAGLRRLLR